MPRLTEEEYAALEEEITRSPPDVDPAKARRPVRMVAVDDLAAAWLRVKAEAVHKTTTEIIGDLVRKEMTASVST
jgi:hypothetical protein